MRAAYLPSPSSGPFGAREDGSFPAPQASACGALTKLGAAGMVLLAVRKVQRRRRPAVGRRQAPVAAQLAPSDQWIGQLDLQAFGKEVHKLGARLRKEQGPADQKHLMKMVSWSRICMAVGLLTMWTAPNPLTVLALSLWTHSAWTMIGHHVCHGGYNRTDKTGAYVSRGFALGSLRRRIADWFDWMLPEAWNMEHNNLHHYRLGEDSDPDLVERNSAVLMKGGGKMIHFLSMLVWKWAYYAPNTYKELKVAELRRAGKALPEGFDPLAPVTLGEMLEGKRTIFSLRELVTRVIGPYFMVRFFMLPLPLLLLSPVFYLHAVGNLLLADVVSNVHAFIVIVTNHAGEDLYRFQVGCKPRSPTYYLRAVISSTNFPTGGDLNDFMHGWLNYQIEHHCWPELSMLAYRKGQPELKAICEKHGVPYVQESAFVRLRKTLAVSMGKAFMRRYPKELERKEDIMVWSDEKLREQAAA